MAMSRQSLPPVNQYTSSYTEDVDGDGVRLNAFDHEDASIAYDPLSANRRFAGAADLAVLGTLVFAGPTCHSISVMVPDCLLPPVDNIVRIDLRHRVGLSLGPAVDMTRWSPETHLDRAMCPGPLLDTLELQRREFWGRAGPHSEEVEEYKRQQVSGLWRVDQDQHGPPHQAETHYVPVFLAVPGAQLFAVVQI